MASSYIREIRVIRGSLLRLTLIGLAVACFSVATPAHADDWPALPKENATVTIPAQSWPQHPGPRSITILVRYPGGKLENVKADTGIMLSLHNWGGDNCVGTASPEVLAEKLNVVAVCVNYLQSGKKASIDDPEPYDCGYLQALDSLRALFYVFAGLQREKRPFASGRLFATGGSGGGNVSLMAAKLAPRTFAAIIDLCGMKKLSHDIAFHLPGGSDLDARWSRDPKSPNYLSVDEQEIRFVGHPGHLQQMQKLGTTCKIIVVHGNDDTTCPTADAREMVANMQAANIDVEPHFISQQDLDGKVFTSTGHSLGNRTEIVLRVGEKYLPVAGSAALVRRGPTDFERKDEEVAYRTTNGRFVISYKNGFPEGRFEPQPPPPQYPDHQDLTYVLDAAGKRRPIQNADDWQQRRAQVLESMQLVMGPLPGPLSRVPLDPKTVTEVRVGDLLRRTVTYQSDPYDRVTAYLFLPATPASGKLPAVLCLHQTATDGKGNASGVSGSPTMHYALELARRGYVTLVPDYPTFGEHPYNYTANPEYVSGTMKAIWDNIRSVDLLETLPEVDGTRIGVIGHSLGGHNAMFTAAFEPRLKVIVSSCGFTRLGKDDLPSWTGPTYMPRIKTVYENKTERMPFDFPEIIGTFAPRPFLACAAEKDSDFDVTGVQDSLVSAEKVYGLWQQQARLQGYYPKGPHDFPDDAREKAYQFLDQYLRK